MAVTLKSRFPEIVAELRPKVGAAVKQAAEVVAEGAAQRVPDRTPLGQGLIASIHVEREDVAEYAVVAGDNEVFYGHFVEFGHAAKGGGQVAPRPFLVPAAEASADTAAALITAALRGL